MQRRQQLRPNISPPSHNSPTMGSLSPSSSSSSSRRTTRIWVPVFFILLLLTLIHFLLPSSHSSSSIHQPNYSNADLKAKNYLNSSEPVLPNPFEFCPSYSPGDKIGAKYGAVTLSKSRMHLGSGARIQRVLNKALAGQSVTISVLGGSGMSPPPFLFRRPKLTYDPPVSACHGAGDDPISPTCYPSRFFQWWNTVFPHPATELTNGALRRTNSGYFGYCNSHHLPDQTDLVIIELDTEDEPCVSFVSFLSLPPVFFFSSLLLFVIGLMRPPCIPITFFMPPYRHHPPQRTFSHLARVAAHEAHPILLICSAMTSCIFIMALPFSHLFLQL
jgi:hypothetical protein